MNKDVKAVLRFAAHNLVERSKRARAIDDTEAQSRADAYQISASYLLSMVEGHLVSPRVCKCKEPNVEEVSRDLSRCKRCLGLLP